MESLRERKIRRRYFTVLLMVCGATWLSGLHYAVDADFMSYLLTQVFATSATILSAYWAFTVGTKSTVFKWIVILTLGVAVANSWQLYARYFWITGQMSEYEKLMASSWWNYRQVPETVAMAFLLSVILSRMLGGRSGYATD